MGIHQNMWSIKISIFLIFTILLKTVSSSSTHGNCMNTQADFFFFIYINFISNFFSLNQWYTAKLSCATGFVEAVTG